MLCWSVIVSIQMNTRCVRLPLTSSQDFVPSAVVAPGSTADVQAIVRWANRWLIPLWVISIGRNLGQVHSTPWIRRCTQLTRCPITVTAAQRASCQSLTRPLLLIELLRCRVPGSVLVDMGKRLNQVLSVDENAATCLLQPGVTFIGLYEELKRRGLGDKLWIDVPDLGGGSVIGNTLDRGVGYTRAKRLPPSHPTFSLTAAHFTAMGDHWAQHCGLEVVLPNGEIVRTGMDAMPGSAWCATVTSLASERH